MYQHAKHWKQQRKKIISKEHFKIILLLVVILCLSASLGVLALFFYYAQGLPDPHSLSSRSVRQSTKIFDRTGQHLLYEIHGDENRTLARLGQSFCDPINETTTDPNGIPLFAIQATIAAEDKSFCSHSGFSIKGILRSVFLNLRGQRVGGSTLTQQLVKNAILSNEKEYSRKIKELILSIEIERRYTKDEILQIYFNEIPYGSTNYGIQAASENYFGKSVNQLTLSEAAILAALPQRPTTLLNDHELLLARRNWILNRMVELGFISSNEAKLAEEEPISLIARIDSIHAPHFVFYVKQLLEEQYGFGQRQVEEGGLRVITSLDFEKQQIAEEEIKKGVENLGLVYGFDNAALVAMDPKTGQILSMVGSKDYFDSSIDGQVNVALRPRQPGSSFKPLVYAQGFVKGYTPNTILWDVKTDFPTQTGPYTPSNFNGKEYGPVTIRKALQGSLNIPAVEMGYLVGTNELLDLTDALHYQTLSDRSRFGLSLSLGSGEVTLLEHTAAYATFANDGVYQEPVAILRIEDSNKVVLHEWKEKKGLEIFPTNVAHMISNVLSDNASRAYIFGIKNNLSLEDRPVAAKSGTSNDTSNRAHDGWLMGYTPSLVAGVWGGNTDNRRLNANAGGSTMAAPIWNAFMKRALENTEKKLFPEPQIPYTGIPIIDGTLPSTTVIIDRSTQKLATDYTPKSFREEKTFIEYHSILHYISKENPLVFPPENPQNDPHYEVWEKAIQEWIQKQEAQTGKTLVQGTAPTEFDNIHVPENFPTISIETPDNNTQINDSSFTVSVNAFAKHGISRVEYYLDQYFLGRSLVEPFSFTTDLPNTIRPGFYTLKVIAYDLFDNAGSASVRVEKKAEGSSVYFEILDPKTGQNIEKNQEFFRVVLSLENPENFTYVRVYAESLQTGEKTPIGTIMEPSSPFLTIPWTIPEPGDWIILAHAEGPDTFDADTLNVLVHVLPSSQLTSNQSSSEEEIDIFE